MKTMKHWTPTYIVNRVKEFFFRKNNPETPWLTPKAIYFLDQWLTPEKSGMELGSGRSTSWIAKRCGYLVSIESDATWHNQVNKMIREKGIKNVNYIFAPLDNNSTPTQSAYLSPLGAAPPESFDFILVDGDFRDHAALMAIPKVKSNGLLIVDNANWFLPSETKSPSSVRQNEKCKTVTWEEFNKQVSGWKKEWTSNGITDTVFFFKP